MLLAAMLLCFAGSALATLLVRRYAVARNVIDRPNERSSHRVATPRGGGLAIVALHLSGLALLAWQGAASRQDLVALVAGGLLVAGVGWWDDHGGLPALWRFVVHLAASIVAVALIGGITGLAIGGRILELGRFGLVLSVLGVVWLINLTNFMDGIDGIAASEAFFVALVIGCFGIAGQNIALAGAALLLAAAAAGFLIWNWPPARIFMGDVGSGYLGFALGALILWGARDAPDSLWALGILPGAFIADATTTLLRRMAGGRRWYEAHRSHAYQHAALRWGHGRTTLGVCALNLGWLLPLSVLAYLHPQAGGPLLAVSWIPLFGLAWHLRAGKEDLPAPA